MYKSTSNIWGFHHLEGDCLIEDGLSSETQEVALQTGHSWESLGISPYFGVMSQLIYGDLRFKINGDRLILCKSHRTPLNHH